MPPSRFARRPSAAAAITGCLGWLPLILVATCHITSTHCGGGSPSLVVAAMAGADPKKGGAAGGDPTPLIDEPACPELRMMCSLVQMVDTAADGGGGGQQLGGGRTLMVDRSEQEMLECVQTLTGSQIEALSDECQHVIWRHTVAYMADRNVQRLIAANCSTSGSDSAAAASPTTACRITDKPGQYLACMLDTAHRDAHHRSAACTTQLQRLELVAFSDFRLIGVFFKDCERDIEQHSCGRLNAEHQTVSQGETLACLQQHIDTLQSHCRDGVLRLSEYQADNVRLDRQLFNACAADAERLCTARPGTGAVYKCLLRNKADPRMSALCVEQLVRRDKLIAHDYRVSKGLARSCREDIKLNRCRRGVSEDKDVRLAQILLCLETAHKNGTKLQQDCVGEMDDHRRLLMEDYHMSPELLSGCADDVGKFCKQLEQGGKTIHCLMERARPTRQRLGGKGGGRLTAMCLRALETVVKVADVAEDWRVDPVLRQACKPVVDEACGETAGGDARVMSCLMEKLGTRYMRTDCEQALMQIQYFVARNFKLDPQLYRGCKEDAVHFCHAKRSWDDVSADDAMDPERAPMILPCLHRYAYHPEPARRLRAECLREVKRVMRQRAISVDLIPEVEDECLADLAAMCFDKTEKGEEMQCLQDNLEKLQAGCRKAVAEYTEEEAGNVELNPVIMTYCRTAMERSCPEVLRSDRDDGAMMECLIAHKNDAAEQRPDQKCRAAIEHFQITALKSYHFTFKFKEACRPHVMRFCPASKSKYDVVACLSEVMRNDTLKGQRPTIPKECRQQVRAQLFQQRENIEFDPRLKQACSAEIGELCSTVARGSGQVLECLQSQRGHLGADCAHHLFTISRSELADSTTDYTLITQCRSMIRQYCRKDSAIGGGGSGAGDHSDALACLKIYRDEPLFDRQCHLVVVNRMIVQNLDFRYNPKLQAACSANIAEFCTPIVAKARRNEELNGRVVECLRARFREGQLSETCQVQMTEVLHEQALNYRLNPLLQAVCRDEIRIICGAGAAAKPQEAANGAVAVAETGAAPTPDEHGAVEECLKQAFLEHRLMSKHCRFEVATMIEESRADIAVDPLLQQACQVDLLRYCSKVQSGNGRQLQCLQIVLAKESEAMEPDCRLKLQRRMEMFSNAALVVRQPPEDLHQLLETVGRSNILPHLAMFMLVLLTVTFAIGLLMGRVTKRLAAKLK